MLISRARSGSKLSKRGPGRACALSRACRRPRQRRECRGVEVPSRNSNNFPQIPGSLQTFFDIWNRLCCRRFLPAPIPSGRLLLTLPTLRLQTDRSQSPNRHNHVSRGIRDKRCGCSGKHRCPGRGWPEHLQAQAKPQQASCSPPWPPLPPCTSNVGAAAQTSALHRVQLDRHPQDAFGPHQGRRDRAGQAGEPGQVRQLPCGRPHRHAVWLHLRDPRRSICSSSG